MTALWAYSGAADPALEQRLDQVLRHRGHVMPATADTPSEGACHLGVRLPRASASLGGTARVGGSSFAVAGRLVAGQTTELIARMLCADGVAALADVRGEWVIAWTDGRRLTVARDPMGVRTVYWGQHEGRTIVAVEPKGVLAAPGFPRRLDVGAVAQFLTFSFVPGERCTLLDLREVPAGHFVDIDIATQVATTTRWFVHEDSSPDTSMSTEVAVAAVRRSIDDAVAERVDDDEPVVAFLSGGLDSSIVATAATGLRRRRGARPPTLLSLHFGLDHPNELEFASAVAARTGAPHIIQQTTGRDAGALLRELVWYLDDPIGDPVTVGNYALARLARGHADRVLNGEGGDPVFGGPKNLPMLLGHAYPTLEGVHPREDLYLATWRRAGEEIVALLHPDLRSEYDYERDLVDVVRPFLQTSRPEHFLNKLMVANMRLKGAHLILPKVDRMLGAHGLTPLSPLFDVDVVRTSMTIPPDTKLRHGIEKWVLKRAYADLLPESVVYRPKSGMRVPVSSWFRQELKRESRALLSPRNVRRAGVFDPDRVRDVVEYRTGRDGIRLWMLTTFELWRRMVFDRETL